MSDQDPGKHYRHIHRQYLTKIDIANGYVDVQIDPYRIALVYKMIDHMEFFVLKKILRLGNAHKDKKQELFDIKNACDRRIEILDEEYVPAPKVVVESILHYCTYPNCNCPIEKPFDHSPCFRS